MYSYEDSPLTAIRSACSFANSPSPTSASCTESETRSVHISSHSTEYSYAVTNTAPPAGSIYSGTFTVHDVAATGATTPTTGGETAAVTGTGTLGDSITNPNSNVAAGLNTPPPMVVIAGMVVGAMPL